jgi:FkbM family methyltransferase
LANKLTGEILRFCSLTDNFKIELNLSDSSENYLLFGCHSKEIISFLSSNLQPDSVFFDCGANLGTWTIIAFESIKKEGAIHCFEPNPKLCQRMKKNLVFNNLDEQCNLHQVALSSDSKTRFLYLDDWNHQMALLRKWNDNINKIKVTTTTIDSFNYKRIDDMKSI